MDGNIWNTSASPRLFFPHKTKRHTRIQKTGETKESRMRRWTARQHRGKQRGMMGYIGAKEEWRNSEGRHERRKNTRTKKNKREDYKWDWQRRKNENWRGGRRDRKRAETQKEKLSETPVAPERGRERAKGAQGDREERVMTRWVTAK